MSQVHAGEIGRPAFIVDIDPGAVVFLEHGVQRGHDGNAQIAQQGEHEASRRPAVNAVFVLEGDDVGVAEVEVVGDAAVGVDVALAELEAIVESMESGDVPLADLLAKFEEGNRLLKLCEARLKDAEMKIEQLKKQNGGGVFAKFEGEPQE